MTSEPTDLLRFCQAELAWQLDTIEALVRLESPSDDDEALTRCAAELVRRLEHMGGRVAGLDDGDARCVRAVFGEGVPRVILLGHLDTVWPIGTLEMARRDGKLYGPGVYDMKGGLAVGLQAVRALEHAGALRRAAVLFLCTTDEEVGSARSRALIEESARQAAAVLVLEPPLTTGAVKTGRKGVGDYRVELTGLSAHAGVAPGRGASAIHALIGLSAEALALARPEAGTTVNVGVVEGGTRGNVVAERAAMEVDIRVESMAEASRVDAAMRALAPADGRVRARVLGGINRPPMERSPAVLGLYEQAREVAAALGHDLLEGTTGGASDGNFTAALGVPTLDGLGALGDGAHARDEHIVIEALAFRSALLAGLIARLGGAGGRGSRVQSSA